MNNEYHDIRSRIAEPPQWWDEYAVPRYCDFAPKHAANIYATEAALVLIQCQSCETEFRVCISGRGGWIAPQIRDGSLHFGDPPNTGCCLGGNTMNCIDVRVIEYWRRRAGSDWERNSSLEIGLGQPPALSIHALTEYEQPTHDELETAPWITDWRWSPTDTAGLYVRGICDGRDFTTAEIMAIDPARRWVRDRDGRLYRLGIH